MDKNTILLSINFLIAILPALFLCGYIYYKDIIEKEPFKLLMSLFFIGILITVPVSYLEDFLIKRFELYEVTPLKIFILSFLVIALIEELAKYLITFFGVWKNNKFDYIYDGIVYATFTSLGFAFFENIFYVMNRGLEVGIMRAVISVPAHGFFAIISGYFLGLAKFNKYIGYQKNKRISIVLSILIPILLHGIFDYLLFMENKYILVIFYIFVVLMYSVSFMIIKKVSKTQMTTPMR